MIKILSLPVEIDTETLCDICGCIFNYEYEDTSCFIAEYPTSKGFSSYIKRVYVDCPFCHNRIDVKWIGNNKGDDYV